MRFSQASSPITLLVSKIMDIINNWCLWSYIEYLQPEYLFEHLLTFVIFFCNINLLNNKKLSKVEKCWDIES